MPAVHKTLLHGVFDIRYTTKSCGSEPAREGVIWRNIVSAADTAFASRLAPTGFA